MLTPERSAMPTAMGVSAAIVPQLVPMLREMKHEAMKMPGRMNCSGKYLSAKYTVASTAPMALADDANVPASMKIESMRIIVGFPAPLANTLIRCSILPLTVASAKIALARKATVMGTL